MVVIPTNTPTPIPNLTQTPTNSSNSDKTKDNSTLTNSSGIADTEERNLRPLIIAIIIGSVVLVIGLYMIMVEIPYQRRKKAYYRKWNRK